MAMMINYNVNIDVMQGMLWLTTCYLPLSVIAGTHTSRCVGLRRRVAGMQIPEHKITSIVSLMGWNFENLFIHLFPLQLKPHRGVRWTDRPHHPGTSSRSRRQRSFHAFQHGVRDTYQRRAVLQNAPGREPELSEQAVQLPAPGAAAQPTADVVLLQNVRDAHIKT